jgi:hypothetical protein
VTDLIHGIRQARNALVANIGLTLPPFEVELDDTLAVDEMRFVRMKCRWSRRRWSTAWPSSARR